MVAAVSAHVLLGRMKPKLPGLGLLGVVPRSIAVMFKEFSRSFLPPVGLTRRPDRAVRPKDLGRFPLSMSSENPEVDEANSQVRTREA